MRPRATIDVSHLPNSAWDERSPLWWGNLCDECAKLADMDATHSQKKNGTEG